MIFFDLETRSEIDLTKVGAWVYSQHPSTEVLCMAYRSDVESDYATLWTPGQSKPQWLGGERRMAHNAWFERCLWANCLAPRYGFPSASDDLWYCSQAWAASFALPQSLSGAGAALGLGTQKDKEGHTLMLRMCRPTREWVNRATGKPEPPKWHEGDDSGDLESLGEYCKRDVDTLYALAQRLDAIAGRIGTRDFGGLERDFGGLEREAGEVGGSGIRERDVWLSDQRINRRGLPCDLEQARAAVDLMTAGLEKANREIFSLSKGAIKTVNQVAKIKDFCGLRDAQKETVLRAIKASSGEQKKILGLRRDYGKSAISKYQAMLDRVGSEGYVRGSMIYHGASTGRWTGTGFQALNLFKSEFSHRDIADIAIPAIKRRDTDTLEMLFGSVPAPLASSLRASICAPEGFDFVCADYSSIEAIGTAWFVGDGEDLEMFRQGDDPYKPLASLIFKKPVGQVTKKERALGKVARLGAQYGMGQSKEHPTFQRTCEKWGIDIEFSFALEVIYDIFRVRYANIVDTWRLLDRSIIQSLKIKRPVVCGKVKFWHNREDDFLHCGLPSNRVLSYYQPRLGVGRFGGECVSYMSMTTLPGTTGRKWGRRDGYGGLWLENIIQGMCRDFLIHGMFQAEASGYKTILTIYDEVVAMVPEGFGSLEDFCELLSKPIDWAPGCPIRAAGWRGRRYRKD